MNLQKSSRSIDILELELHKRGWNSEVKIINNLKYEQFTKNGYSWITKRSRVEYPFVSEEQRQIAADKYQTNKVVISAGYNVPVNMMVSSTTDTEQMIDFLNKHKPIVVKPLDSSGSKGLTLNVNAPSDLSKALKIAKQKSKTTLLQKQVGGEELRFTVLDNKVISVIQKQTPRLYGDGVKTLNQLLQIENNERAKLTQTLIKYAQLELPSKKAGEFVLPKGESYSFNNSSLVSKGASLYELLDEVDVSYINNAINIAGLFKLGFCTVDCHVEDWHDKADQKNWYFLEVNTGPALSMYYSTRNNKNTPVTELLGQKIDSLVTED